MLHDATGTAPASDRPTVSVIVPVWNVEPWLGACLDSVERQSIGTTGLELIAVDDGSTDASGRLLDEFAATRPWVTVVHQANSGGPGGPRNVGLERARGRYVFFLDGDDYLGPEALEHLVAMAERNGSDIVLGTVVAIEGRATRRRSGVFRHNHDRVSAERVFRSGNVFKLVRRSLLDRTSLRFQPGVAGGEDGDFMARAYLEAGTISVVADYDCYFLRRRPGSQTTRADRRDDLVEYFARIEGLRIRPVAERRPAGPRRDRLLVKPLAKLANKFWHVWPSRTAAERRAAFDAGAAIARQWLGPGVEARLPQHARLALYCLTTGQLAELEAITRFPRAAAYRDPVVEGPRVFARFPHFRDGTGIPDRAFEITDDVRLEVTLERAELRDGRLEVAGRAYLRLLGGASDIELRRWPRGARLRLPTEHLPTPLLRDRLAAYAEAGVRAAIDVGAVPDGIWRLTVTGKASGVRRSAPLRLPSSVRRTRRDRVVGRDGDVMLRTSRQGTLELVVGRSPLGRFLNGVADRWPRRGKRRPGRALSR